LRTQVLGQFALSHGAFAQADRLLTDAVSLSAGVEGAQDVAAVAGTRLAGLRAWQGRGEEAVACARRVLESPEIDPHVALRATIYLVEGTLLSRGAGPALEALDAATASHRPVSGPGDAYRLAWRGGVLMFSGELAAAAESLSAARRAAANGSAVDAEVVSRLWTAYTMYLLGEWDEANISSDQAAAIAFAEEWQWAYVPIHAVAAIVAAGRGEWDRSAHHTEQTQHWSRSSPPGFAVFPCLAAAAVAQARDDPAAMLDALGPMREGHADGWPRVLEPWWRPMLIEALARTQRLDEARVELDRLADIRDEARYLRLAHDWLSGLVAEESGDPARARECFERGLAPGMSAIDPPLLRARLEHSYGRISLTSRARRTFSGWLATAHERFLSLRAMPFAERCALDMVAAGISERQPEADPLDTLTDRERSIARLIAGGATNRDVARELFVSIKTVEYHLGHIFAKLGVSSRSQLRAMLRPA
jgi:DNA-binding CsgD family transcriptional regulator